jgi:hypothetical protein
MITWYKPSEKLPGETEHIVIAFWDKDLAELHSDDSPEDQLFSFKNNYFTIYEGWCWIEQIYEPHPTDRRGLGKHIEDDHYVSIRCNDFDPVDQVCDINLKNVHAWAYAKDFNFPKDDISK